MRCIGFVARRFVRWLAWLGRLALPGLLVCVLSGPAGAASLLLQLEAGGPTAPGDFQLFSSPGPGPLTGLAQQGGVGMSGSQALGSADFGLLSLLAGAESIDPGSVANPWSSFGIASWEDSFTIVPTDPALLGTQGTLTAVVGVAGSGGVQGIDALDGWSGSASWSLTLQLGNHFSSFNGSWTGSSVSPPSYAGDPLSTGVVATTAFVFGLPTPTLGSLSVGATAGVNSSGKAESFSNFLSTIEWLGFQEVLDANGLALGAGDFAVQSESGTNWALPVPEPTTLPQVGIALAALAAWRRRSHRRGSR